MGSHPPSSVYSALIFLSFFLLHPFCEIIPVVVKGNIPRTLNQALSTHTFQMLQVFSWFQLGGDEALNSDSSRLRGHERNAVISHCTEGLLTSLQDNQKSPLGDGRINQGCSDTSYRTANTSLNCSKKPWLERLAGSWQTKTQVHGTCTPYLSHLMALMILKENQD